MQIESGTGNGYRANVTDENKLRAYCTTESEISYESETNERAYTWSHSYDYDANDTILWLKNTSSTEHLIIDRILIGSDTTTLFTVHFPEDTTQAGTAITGTNLNRQSGKTASASAVGDETGNSQGTIMAKGIVLANTTVNLPVEGSIILGLNDEIGIDLVTAGTLCTCVIRGYYHTAK